MSDTILRLLRRPLRIHQRGAEVRDSYNNVVYPYETTYDVLGYIEQRSTVDEVVIGQDTYHSDWLVVLPAGSPLAGWDKVEALDTGTMVEVIGPPNRPQVALTATEHHVEAKARLTA